ELDNRFIVDDVELKRGGVSYTYDTLIELERKYKNVLTGKFGLVMGSDLLPAFHLWHRAEDIASMVDFVLAGRPKDCLPDVPVSDSNNVSKADYSKFDSVSSGEMEYDRLNFKYPHFVLKNAFLDISSSQIRNYICNGLAWRYLVPDVVYRYILNKHLYGCN
ncbi:MAG: nicotinate-nicotinamide nucleotide adenylyltransferase, partial [Treponema sp.]|nr:nicotinate-nicotinamide nucleotide adenylyltransferase [Treponema sp.]